MEVVEQGRRVSCMRCVSLERHRIVAAQQSLEFWSRRLLGIDAAAGVGRARVLRQLHGWHHGHVVFPPDQREATPLPRVSLGRRARHEEPNLYGQHGCWTVSHATGVGFWAGVFRELTH